MRKKSDRVDGVALENAERHYQRLPHIERISLVPYGGGAWGREGLFAVVVPDTGELTLCKVTSARQRIGELLDAAGAQLPGQLRVRDFVLREPAQPRTVRRLFSPEEVVRRAKSILARAPRPRAAACGELARTLDGRLVRRFFARLKEFSKIPGPFESTQELERDLGLDSLAMLEMRIVLEQEFGVSVPDSEFWRLRTVGDVLERLKTREGVRDARAETSWGKIIAQPPMPSRRRVFDPERRWVHRVLFLAIKCIVWIVTRICFRVEIVNPEKLDLEGAVVIAPNHVGYLDPLFIYAAFPARLIRRTHFVAFAEILSKPHLAWVGRFSRLILTGNAETTVDSLRAARQALEEGDAVCIFPEGSRSPSSRLMPPRPGAGMLSAEAQAPILPVFIEGGERVTSPRYPGLHFPKVRIIVGDPIAPPAIPQGETGRVFERADYEAITERWREQVLRLTETSARKEGSS